MAVNKKRVKSLPNPAIPLFKKRITIICIICGVVMPFIANYVLSYIMINIKDNLLYTTEFELLNAFITSLTTVSMFALFGVIVNSIVRFGLKKSIVPLCFGVARTLLFYIFTIELCANDMGIGFFDFLSASFSSVALNAGIDLLLLAGVVILTVFLRAKFLNEKKTNITVKKFFDFKNPLIAIYIWVIILVFAFYLSGCITETVSIILAYNSYEVFALISPYLGVIGKTAVGYVIMWGCAKWLDFQWKSLNNAK